MAGHQYEGITVTNSSNTWLGDTHVNNYYFGKPDGALNLKVAKGAVFDDRENEKSPLCHPQTRKRLLAEIAQWADDPEGKCIFWLRGAAGTGKSTISRTVAKSFSDEGKLAASFFFNRTIDDCRKADLFVTTIANQLIRNVHRAQNIQGLKELILNVIHKNPDLPSKGLKEQFETLILGPLEELEPVGTSTTTLVLAIDALDECDNEEYTGAGPYLERTRMIVGLLGELASVTGIKLRVFITSRPELPIQLGFKHDVPKSFHQDVSLHEIPPSEIEHDIRAYLEHELKRMQSLYDISPPWPDSDTTTFLVHRCSPLFIYAATICRFMDNPRLHPKIQLEKILDSRYKSTNKMAMTYGAVLDQLVHGLDESDCQDVIIRFRRIVGSIILLADPLPVSSLSQLLDDCEDEVFHHLQNLRSVLSVPDEPKSDQLIKVFHLSFPEYLLDKSGESNPFFIEEQQQHSDLLDCCLRVMGNRNQYGLQNDICRLDDPGVLKEDVATKKIREHIPRHLEYACVHWVYHFEKSHCPTNETKIYNFLTRLFVPWLEAMSWLGRIGQSIDEVRKLRAMFHSPGSKHEIALFLEDAGRFVAEHRYTINAAPCQVYVSALLFSPSDSVVKQAFRSEIPKWVIRAPGTAAPWNVASRFLHTYWSDVRGMCYSDDGLYLVVATKKEVNVWNMKFDTLCAAKDDFTSHVSCITFTTAESIAVGLVSGSIVVWNWIRDQQSIENLSKSCVAYLSSSSNGGLVCGFCDGGVYLWKQDFGILHQWKTHWRPKWNDLDQIWKPLPAIGISYSIDGSFVAIIRDGWPDHIDVYDANSGCYAHEICAPKERIFGSLSILPNSLLLAISGSYSEWGWFDRRYTQIQLWDLSANVEVPVEEFSLWMDLHPRLAMNQSRMLCLQMTESSGLDIWNMRETPVLIQTFEGVHQSCLSPDGRYIAAASDGHVTIIDTLHLLSHDENKEGFRLSQSVNEHLLWSTATSSPDGSRLGTISSHGRVIVWDFPNGEAEPTLLNPLDPLRERRQHALALSWSADGTSLVAAMPNKLISYCLLSGHEPTKDEYRLELTANEDRKGKRTRRYLCRSPRGSYLAMMNHIYGVRCEIVMWKWEGCSLRHFWTKDLVLKSTEMPCESEYLAFSPDEIWLACLAPDQWPRSLVLINVPSGSVEWQTKIHKDWYPNMIAFDSIGCHIVIGASDIYQDGTDDQVHNEMDDKVDDEVHDEVHDAMVSEDDEGDKDNEGDNESDTESEESDSESEDIRVRAFYAFVFNIHERGRFLRSEPIDRWGKEYEKSFSVRCMGDVSIVVEPQHWLRLKHIAASQFYTHEQDVGVSCHVYIHEKGWIMKGNRRKICLPRECSHNVHVNNWSSLPHRLFGYNRSSNKPWLVELDCNNCIFPGNFLEMKSDIQG